MYLSEIAKRKRKINQEGRSGKGNDQNDPKAEPRSKYWGGHVARQNK